MQTLNRFAFVFLLGPLFIYGCGGGSGSALSPSGPSEQTVEVGPFTTRLAGAL